MSLRPTTLLQSSDQLGGGEGGVLHDPGRSLGKSGNATVCDYLANLEGSLSQLWVSGSGFL